MYRAIVNQTMALNPKFTIPVTKEELLSAFDNPVVYKSDDDEETNGCYMIGSLYSDLQEELDNWYHELTFSQLAIVHEIDEPAMYSKTNEETQEMLDELTDEWVEWSTDTKVMWYNQIMGY